MSISTIACHSRPRLQPARAASSVPAPGGGGGDIGGGGAKGYGGGGGDGGDAGKHKKPKSGLMKGWEERVASDPEFAYKVFVEQVCFLLGVLMCVCTGEPCHITWYLVLGT